MNSRGFKKQSGILIGLEGNVRIFVCLAVVFYSNFGSRFRWKFVMGMVSVEEIRYLSN